MDDRIADLMIRIEDAIEQRDAAEAEAAAARTEAAEQIIEAIKVRRQHHIACGTDLLYLAGLYEAVKVAQEFAVPPDTEATS